MKYFVLLALLCSACKRPVNCKDFRTGTFVLEGDTNYKFVRTSDTQIETNLSTGDTTVFDITWLDDCSYRLNFREGYYPKRNDTLIMTVKIIKTAGDYMYYESTAKGYSRSVAGKLLKVK